MAKLIIDNKKIERLYIENSEAAFRLAFVHTCSSEETRDIINGSLLDAASSESIYAKVSKSPGAYLREIHRLLIAYYKKKLRKPVKTDVLKRMNVPFEMTDIMVDILHLPIDCKTPLVLTYSCGFSVEEAAAIAGKRRGYIERQLKRAKKELSKYTDEQITACLKSIVVPETTHRRIIDKFFVSAEDKKFGGNRVFKRFQRRADELLPYICLVIILFIIFCFAAVEFHWFGFGI